MRDNTKCLSELSTAVYERLTDKKNADKGDYPTDLKEILLQLMLEVGECVNELSKEEVCKNHLRSEFADVAAYCAFGILQCLK